MLITVFTPTYNRQNTLVRLYESLLKQTHSSKFEWIIVDDASTDNTETMVNEWVKINNPKFDIKYFKLPHGGKHRAINYAIKVASGKYFYIVDSDDMLTKDALESIEYWISLTDNDPNICGVAGLRINKQGEIIGSYPFYLNAKFIDASNFERIKYSLYGDKSEVYRTELLCKFPFPCFENEYFVTEDVVWNQLAYAGYKVRWFPKGIYICEYRDDGLTLSGANEFKGHMENFKGYSYYIRQLIQFQGLTKNPRKLQYYYKVSKAKNRSVSQRAKDLNVTKLKSLILPVFIFIGFTKSFIKKACHRRGMKK